MLRSRELGVNSLEADIVGVDNLRVNILGIDILGVYIISSPAPGLQSPAYVIKGRGVHTMQ